MIWKNRDGGGREGSESLGPTLTATTDFFNKLTRFYKFLCIPPYVLREPPGGALTLAARAPQRNQVGRESGRQKDLG